MYQFMRFGVLIKHDGLPLYAGNRLISKFKYVWWYPINWVFLLCATIEFFRRELLKFLRRKLKNNGDK